VEERSIKTSMSPAMLNNQRSEEFASVEKSMKTYKKCSVF